MSTDAQPGDRELADRISRHASDTGVSFTDRIEVVNAVLTAVSEALDGTTDTPGEFAARLDRLAFLWFRNI